MVHTVTVELFRHERETALPFNPGTVVFRAGDTGDSMYAVLEGEVELDVKGTVVERVGPGGVFGEMALIEHEPRVATARAVTACQLVRVDEKRFRFLVQQHPVFALQIMRVMAARLRNMNERLAPGA
jgi:CRP/FNR family transcriptional regulator, cyclic AMP receptor protein